MKQSKKYRVLILTLNLFFGFGFKALADAPKVGREAAARYFQNEKNAEKRGTASESEGSSGKRKGHYMAVGFGTFSESTAYNWGQNGKEDKIGKWGADLTYRLDEQEYLFDQSLKVSYAQYGPVNQEASKLSFLFAMTLPEAGSKFPLYFGAAGGLGLFLKQLSDESVISLDYQLYLGLRTFNVFDTMGLFVEGGLRNHLQVTSDGQFNGTFLSLGSVFVF
jgi:hypothetical protein